MTATLASIDTALLTALADKVAVPATALRPFALAARYAGEVTREGLSRVCGGQFPAVLLRFDGEQSRRIVDVLASVEDRGIATWSVIAVAEDPREVDSGINDTTVATPGVLQLLDAAMGAVNGLLVAGTYNERPLRCSDVRPELVDAGVVYAYGARVEAMRDLPQAVNPDPAAGLPALNPIVGDVNLEGTGFTENPLVQFQAEPPP